MYTRVHTYVDSCCVAFTKALSYLVLSTAQSAYTSPPPPPANLLNTNLTSLGRIQLCYNDYAKAIYTTPLFIIAILISTAEWIGAKWTEQNCQCIKWWLEEEHQSTRLSPKPLPCYYTLLLPQHTWNATWTVFWMCGHCCTMIEHFNINQWPGYNPEVDIQNVGLCSFHCLG